MYDQEKLRQIREKDLMNNVKTFYNRHSQYVLFELSNVYYSTCGEEPKPSMSRWDMIIRIMNVHYGEENVKRAIEKLGLKP